MTDEPAERPAGPKAAGVKGIVSAARRRPWLLYPILILLALAAWAISSPPGSSPDEDYHLISAWCAHGTRPGLCVGGSTYVTKIVPMDLARVACFASDPKLAGDCPTYPAESIETNRGNFEGYYPNGFYWLMGLFAGYQTGPAVVAMRLCNAAIYALGIGGLLWLARPPQRSNYLLASLVTMVPLGMFTVASVNPSSWAITSATLIWPGAVEFVRAPDRGRRVALGGLVGFGVILALASRADAAAYAGLAIVLAWLATLKLRRRTLIYGGLTLLVVAAMVTWAVSLGSVAALFSGSPIRPEEIPSGWWQRLQDLPGFYFDTFTRGLGWLDTRPRSGTWALAGVAYFAAVFWGLRRTRWRKAVTLAVVFAIGAAIPLLVATARHAMVAETLQQRYFVPLMIIAVMIALAEDNPDGPELHRVQAWLVVAALTIANANALHTNLRRYITGLDGKWFNLNVNMQWWWSSTTAWAPAPMVVFGVGAIAFLGAVTIAAVTGTKTYEPYDTSTTSARRAIV